MSQCSGRAAAARGSALRAVHRLHRAGRAAASPSPGSRPAGAGFAVTLSLLAAKNDAMHRLATRRTSSEHVFGLFPCVAAAVVVAFAVLDGPQLAAQAAHGIDAGDARKQGTAVELLRLPVKRADLRIAPPPGSRRA